jgi:adenylate cyclase
LREEAREYEQVRSRVEESKKRSGEAGEGSSIPTEVVEATYALMIGHTALSQSSRPPIIAEHPPVLPALVAIPSPEHHLSARQFVEESLRRDPQSAETWSQLAVLLVSDYLNNWNEAKQNLEAAQDLLRRAEQSLQEALKIDPTVAIAHLAAGLIRRANGDHQGALDAFDRAVQLEPYSAHALTERANQLVMVGRPTEAPPLVLRAITLSPRDPYIGTFYWVLGRTYFVMRNYDDAIVWLRKAVEISPYVWYNRAYLLAAYALAGRHYQPEGITASNDYKGLFSEYTVQRIRNMYETELPQRDPGMLASIQELCNGLRLAGVTER